MPIQKLHESTRWVRFAMACNEPCACVPGTAGWAKHHGSRGGTLPEAFDEAMESFTDDVRTPLDPAIAALDFPRERHEYVTRKRTKREER